MTVGVHARRPFGTVQADGHEAADADPDEESSPRTSRWWGVALFASTATFYFGVGALLILRYNVFDPDAPSRVANAGLTFMSRYPHLSAIGFVWNPMPSLVEIPFVWLSQWWPPLRTRALAGTVQSALFMAGAVVMLRVIATDRGMGSGWRRLAIAGFALHPVIIVYAQSGLSEAAEIFSLLWAVRYLLRWMDSRLPKDLTWAGIALAVGYLSRYEIVVATAGAVALVGVIVIFRSPAGQRLTSTAIPVMVLVLPIAATFVVWAIIGWVLAGELFAQLSSRYGNAAQVANWVEANGNVRPAFAAWPVIAGRLLGTQPLVLVAAGIAVAIGVFRKRYDLLVPVVTMGPILAFAAYGQHAPTTFGFVRFYITAIPLVTCIAILCWIPSDDSNAFAGARRIGMALCASIFLTMPITAVAMRDPSIGDTQIQLGVTSVLFPDKTHSHDSWYRRLNINESETAKFLDDQHLEPGTVLMDTANTWGIWLRSNNPKQFVLTSDYDFTVKLNRPWNLGVKYIVVTAPDNYNADAVAIRYPKIWETGAGIGIPVLSVADAKGYDAYRIFQVVKPPERARP